jgi:trimeric autotransporter adhesin
MKKIFFFRLLLMLVLSTGMHSIMLAQNFILTDINKISNSFPRNDEFSAKNAFIYFKGSSYFTADDGIHGRELWKTDGTTAGTKMVKDVNPGIASSDISYSYDITTSGGKLYFSAFDDLHGSELWTSDGTKAGTNLLLDINPGNGSANPQYLTDANGILYFLVSYFDNNTFINYNQLWKTDGTAAGTVVVSDFTNGYLLQQLMSVNGRLFFTFYSFIDGTEVYTSDGTTTGTVKVAFTNSISGILPTHLTSANGLLYFAADDGTGGRLWVSDGSVDGTHPVNNSNNINLPVDYTGFRDSFAIINNVLYFQGFTPEAGNELCKYDPSDPNANVTIVKDIVAGSSSSYPSFMTNVNGTLFFTIGPAGADAQLWKSDGSEGGTVLVKDISPGDQNIYYGLTSAYGILMFAYGNSPQGIELWKSDGTDPGTKIVKDINPGIFSSVPQYIAFNNGLFLYGADNGVNGYELWKSNGTAAGTTLVKDINQSSTASSYPFGFTAAANNKIVFGAQDKNNGNSLWFTDGPTAVPKLVKNINAYLFTKFQNKIYFISNDNTGIHLWKTNGTAAGTIQISIPGFIDASGYVYNMIATDNLLYIVVYNSQSNQYILWRSDGTVPNTYILKSDIPAFFNLNLSPLGNTLFFTNYDDFNGEELWKTEGTIAFTGLVKDIFPGNSGSYPSNLFNFNGKLYFEASDGQAPFGNTLWTSDGTDAGTRKIKAILTAYPGFAQGHGKLFFAAENAVAKGTELFATDGTTAGTKLVKDIFPGANSSNISVLISGDTLIYFVADDGTHGYELWKSNGTKEGTKLVKDITPGINSTSFNNYINVNDKLFFTLNDTLWQSDGSKNGTHPVNDANLSGVSNISNLASINGSLYFSGYTYAAGQELYAGNVAGSFAPVLSAANSTLSKQLNYEFSAALLTNPVNDQLKFSVNVKDPQEARIVITDASGRIFNAERKSLFAGTNMFSYDTKSWGQGIYIIRIQATGGSSSFLKAVK